LEEQTVWFASLQSFVPAQAFTSRSGGVCQSDLRRMTPQDGSQEDSSMTDATANFFEELGRRGHEPLLGQVTGTVRFDLKKGNRTEHYFVDMKKGDMTVSRANDEADCVVHADRELFDRFVSGEANAWTAFLRREVTFEGDPQLLVLFQRILLTPHGSAEKSVAIGDERRHA
jgi:putative sterol carrier protein